MRWAGAAGFSLVEVLVALVLLSFASLAVTSTLLTAQRSQRVAVRWGEAVQLAAEGVEQLRAGQALMSLPAGGRFRRRGRVVADAGRPGVATVEVEVAWEDDGAGEYRLATTVMR